MANFAKWLPSSGWEPYVLTIRDVHVERMDPGRLRDLEGVVIDKVGVLPTVAEWYGAVKRDWPGERAPHSRAGSIHAPAPIAIAEKPCPGGSSAIFFLPVFPTMSEAGSCPRLRRIRQIRRHHIKWIMTSARRTPDT